MDEQTLIDKEAQRLTQEIQRMAVKYDDFDDVATLKFMQENGISSIPLAYKQMGGKLDLEDSTFENIHETRQDNFTRVDKSNLLESLRGALHESKGVKEEAPVEQALEAKEKRNGKDVRITPQSIREHFKAYLSPKESPEPEKIVFEERFMHINSPKAPLYKGGDKWDKTRGDNYSQEEEFERNL
jgi:hypothetical protein